MQDYNPLPSRLEVLLVVMPMTQKRIETETDSRILKMLKDQYRAQQYELATIKANKKHARNFNPQWN